jgi:hypothetical protein
MKGPAARASRHGATAGIRHGGTAGIAERVRRHRAVLGRRPVPAGDFGDRPAIEGVGRGHRR